MIVLPGTPPIPTAIKPGSTVPVSIVSARSAVVLPAISGRNEAVRYAVDLEQYLREIYKYAYEMAQSDDPPSLLRQLNIELYKGEKIPWKNVVFGTKATRGIKSIKSTLDAASRSQISWTLRNEVEVVVVSLALTYIRIGAELVNELIDSDDAGGSEQSNEKWRQVSNFYKKSISFATFGSQQVSGVSESETQLNPALYAFVIKIGEVSVQMSMLSKSSWINRKLLDTTNAITTKNNGTLSRVSVFVVNELRACKKLLSSLVSDQNQISLDTTGWYEYLGLVEKYANAYAGLFLSIENYNQDKLGNAIGLVSFSLLNLQSKRFDNDESNKKLSKIRDKFSAKRNESMLTKLDSVSTLNINKSVFNDKSGIVLKDLSYLFDQLISLNLKYTKENNNLKFDEVVHWSDINSDVKWPLGSQIPVSSVEVYSPLDVGTKPAPGRSAYY